MGYPLAILHLFNLGMDNKDFYLFYSLFGFKFNCVVY